MKRGSDFELLNALNEPVARSTCEFVIGESAVMRRVLDAAWRAAAAGIPILLSGQIGASKSALARAIYERSPRASGPFIEVNMGGLTAELASSELLGHEVGAFTDAKRQHRGAFERANGGTVFLDEIGDMPLAAQAKLLRVLETGLVCRVGGSESVHTDFHAIMATCRDLDVEVRDGRFRADLAARIRVLEIVVPPLSERREDIRALAEAFVERFAAERSEAVELGEDAVQLLETLDWTTYGNVRGLKHMMWRTVAFLPVGLRLISAQHVMISARVGYAGEPAKDDSERARLKSALEEHQFEVSRAASALGLTRQQLWRRIARHPELRARCARRRRS